MLLLFNTASKPLLVTFLGEERTFDGFAVLHEVNMNTSALKVTPKST